MRLRPSRLDIAFRCTGSLSLPEVERLSDEADAGKKRHKWLAANPRVGLDALGVEGGPVCDSEVAVEFQGIPGTADLVYETFDMVGVADYKTAGQDKGDPAESAQLLFYACATNASEVAFIYVEDSGPDGECRVVSVRRSPVNGLMREDFRERLRRLQVATPKFATGPHCTFCPSATACPALSEQVGIVLAGSELSLTVDRAGAAWLRIKAVRAACDMAEEAVRALVAHGPVPTRDGKVLAAVEVATESIDAAKAVMVLPGLASLVKKTLAKSDVKQENLVALRKAGATRSKIVVQVREIKP